MKRLIGFRFPFRVENGGVARAEGMEKLMMDVRHLLSTRLGERVMLRGYGGGVHHRLQDPNSGTLRALIKHEIEQALRMYVPDARLVNAVRVKAMQERLQVDVEYLVHPYDVVRRLELELS